MDRRYAAFPDGPAHPAGFRDLPMHTDWAWEVPLAGAETSVRMISGRNELDPGIAAFHDDPRAEIDICKDANGLRFDVLAFEGSYLSLAVDLPEAAARGLGARHVIHAVSATAMPPGAELFLRLNLRVGPNTVALPVQPDTNGHALFDLGGVAFVRGISPRLWLDVIFARPGSGGCAIMGLALSRAPRPRF